MSGEQTLQSLTQQILTQIDRETDAKTIFRLRAAVAALAGDARGCQQNLAASEIQNWNATMEELDQADDPGLMSDTEYDALKRAAAERGDDTYEQPECAELKALARKMKH